MITICRAAGFAALASAAVFAAGAGPARATPTNFHATLSATVTSFVGNCCFTLPSFEGSGVVPMLGRVTFTGGFVFLGTPGQTRPCELTIGIVPCEQNLFIQLTSANGRQVTIRGQGEWSPPDPVPAAWSWTATGDTLNGSGTYVSTLMSGAVTGEIGQPLTIRLSGMLTPR